jgi:sulfotransferase family protein
MRLPDFLIGGAPRSGTTWLYSLLDRHPDVYMAKPVTPEPKFFLVDSVYEKGLPFYSGTWFVGAGSAQLAGEKSTNYLESGVAAGRIAQAIPGVKLVFILRDPVDRAYSNYLWSRMNGIEHEDFAAALALEDERQVTLPERWRFARPFSYFSRGLYADLLEPYLRLFPRRQLLVLRYEDIVSAPEALAARLQRFLGVCERPGDALGLGVINPSEKPGDRLQDDVRRSLALRYEEPNRRLAGTLGPDFEMWL